MSQHTDTAPITSLLLRIGGQVQGVGFRPFVYRLATDYGLNGWVENCGSEVRILLQGSAPDCEALVDSLLHRPPPLAYPTLLGREQVQSPPCSDFTIRTSSEAHTSHPHIPPDHFVCDECLQEMERPDDRRYRYPFINCTQCGPRYTLIERLPYDRPHTTMAGFPLCPDCQQEYSNPADRRFHAEPIACPRCGPELSFSSSEQRCHGNEPSLQRALSVLHQGGILAVKGIGGYHLLCNARDSASVALLRRRKRRPDKPLAVMFPAIGEDGLALINEACRPTPAEADLLRSPGRPIVLCRKQPHGDLADNIAPGLDEVGVLLPYSPLHHLLTREAGIPLVATSGNISGEPVITDTDEAERRLGSVADAFLHHDRPICRPADDPVYRTIGGRPRPLRLGRGNAPLELSLPFRLPMPLLALGGEMKNCIGLAWDNRFVLSPHIGELGSARGLQVFEEVIEALQRLYNVEAQALLHDAHPGYTSSRWAQDSTLAATAIPHHYAHASALYGEHYREDDHSPWLVATWDGVGLGPDGSLWGGETLIGRPGYWQRFARFRPFRPPGGDRVSREPWRSALGLCLECDREWPAMPTEGALLIRAWQQGLNSPQTTAAGRLFDAASALLGLGLQSSFEGQGPMYLEALAEGDTDHTPLPLQSHKDGTLQTDWEPLLDMLTNPALSVAERAANFHHSLAQALCEQALRARHEQGCNTVGLAGGVFQNRLLVDSILQRLEPQGFEVRLAEQIPCNDAALPWGQVVEYAGRRGLYGTE